jgi:hypothetical protein
MLMYSTPRTVPTLERLSQWPSGSDPTRRHRVDVHHARGDP